MKWTCPFLVLLLCFAGTTQANAEGEADSRDCTYMFGRCVEPMQVLLDKKELARLLDPETVPKTPAHSVGINLVTGEKKREPPSLPSSTSGPISHSLSEADYLSKYLQPDTTPKSLSRVTRPWMNSFWGTSVKLIMEWSNGALGGCSGVILGNQTVLTAGHCVYSHDGDGWADTVYVFPAMDGVSDYSGPITPWGQLMATQVVSNSWWVDHHDYRGDTAVLTLCSTIGSHTDWPDITWGGTNYSGVINIGGYPGDPYDGLTLYQGSGEIWEIDEYLVCHGSTAYGGMSGGPTYFHFGGERQVTAVTSYGVPDHDLIWTCSARIIELTDTQIANSEAHAASPLTDYWTCPLSQYYAGDGCDCNCGRWDVDCEDPAQAVSNCPASNYACDYPDTCRCLRQCSGRECGSDSCGGSCGTCTEHQNSYCNESGQCACSPSTCESLGRECGSLDNDGCGGPLECGDCTEHANSYCDESGQCACSPDSCLDLGADCGSIPDGCGGALECGTCTDYLNSYCNESGQCACLPDTCASLGLECGDGDDGCGTPLECGSCSDGYVCRAGRCLHEDDTGSNGEDPFEGLEPSDDMNIVGSCGCAAASPVSFLLGIVLTLLAMVLLPSAPSVRDRTVSSPP